MNIRTHLMARDSERVPMTPEQRQAARDHYWAAPEHHRAIARKSYYKHLEKNRAAARERMRKRAAA